MATAKTYRDTAAKLQLNATSNRELAAKERQKSESYLKDKDMVHVNISNEAAQKYDQKANQASQEALEYEQKAAALEERAVQLERKENDLNQTHLAQVNQLEQEMKSLRGQ